MKEEIEGYEFIGNFGQEELPHYKVCMNAAGLHPLYSNDAFDAMGNKMDETISCYLPNEEYMTPSHNQFYRLYSQVADTYKAELLKTGKISQEFADTHFCYLGIEKLYDFDNMKDNAISPHDSFNMLVYGEKILRKDVKGVVTV